MTSKRIDLGEYVVSIYYDDVSGTLEVKVFDELGDMIDSIKIENDDDDDDDDDDDKTKPDINLLLM